MNRSWSFSHLTFSMTGESTCVGRRRGPAGLKFGARDQEINATSDAERAQRPDLTDDALHLWSAMRGMDRDMYLVRSDRDETPHHFAFEQQPVSGYRSKDDAVQSEQQVEDAHRTRAVRLRRTLSLARRHCASSRCRPSVRALSLWQR